MPDHARPVPPLEGVLREARKILGDCIARADTPDGPHPFLFDTMTLVEARLVMACIDSALTAVPPPEAKIAERLDTLISDLEPFTYFTHRLLLDYEVKDVVKKLKRLRSDIAAALIARAHGTPVEVHGTNESRTPDGDGEGLIARAPSVNAPRQGRGVGRQTGRRPDRTDASDTPNPTTKIADEYQRELSVASVATTASAGSEPADSHAHRAADRGPSPSEDQRVGDYLPQMRTSRTTTKGRRSSAAC